MDEKPFFADYDKRGAAKCKKCKAKIDKGTLRLAKVVSNPFSEDAGTMKQWHHVDCLFDSFKRARATTKKLEDPIDDLEGWDDLTKDDQQYIKTKVKEYLDSCEGKGGPKKATPNKATPKNKPMGSKPQGQTPNKDTSNTTSTSSTSSAAQKAPVKDDMFKEFRKICAKVAEEPSYLGKTEIVSEFLKKGSNKDGFQGDLRLWVRLLLPGVVKRVYNLQSRQLTKVFSQIFNASQEEMLEELEKGDIAETVRIFFEASNTLPPVKKSVLTLQEVDKVLEELEGQTTEEAHMNILKKVAKRSTGNDLKMIVRLIKGDLRINAGAKHILEAVHEDAYKAFQTTRNLDDVLDEILAQNDSPNKAKGSKGLNIQAKVMTPVLPMLAQACRSVDQALEKCPNGMYAEIKYDGERVQLHKNGTEFKYFSRSLKPVMAHKVSHFKNYIPSAFPHGSTLILDAEILLIDTQTSLPLPFGTLGKHKKDEFKNANVCLFVFDCIHFNGVNLMDRPITERRKILEKNMVEIKNHVVLSEMKEAYDAKQLQKMIQRVLSQGLEGLVLKDLKSIYEPGKRHWLKVKKDYLQDGAMADSADLVVLGAWYGTGKKGGMMSVFLMGTYDSFTKKWCTVTKVHTGFDDAALERLQTELDMNKISQNFDQLPSWIKCSKALTPDFVCKDPKKSPVWEITGAEFTKNQIHTADGISIRFPRVTKERPDKDWESATSLSQLKDLYEKSKEHSDFTGLQSDDEGSDDAETSPKKVRMYEKNGTPDEGTDHGVKRKREDSVSPKRLKQPSIIESFSPKKAKEKNAKNHTPRNNKRTDKDANKNSVKSEGESSTKFLKTEKENGKGFIYKPPIKNPLPNIFEGVRMHIPKETEDFQTLQRYFIGYGGEFLSEFDSETTHHLASGEKNTLHSKAVTVDWLWDSIKLMELQPEDPYKS